MSESSDFNESMKKLTSIEEDNNSIKNQQQALSLGITSIIDRIDELRRFLEDMDNEISKYEHLCNNNEKNIIEKSNGLKATLGHLVKH